MGSGEGAVAQILADVEGPAPSCFMARTFFVYILASHTRELYIGVTNDLTRRVAEHGAGLNPDSYSSRHGTSRLVYFEMTSDVLSAIRREKRLTLARGSVPPALSVLSVFSVFSVFSVLQYHALCKLHDPPHLPCSPKEVPCEHGRWRLG
jgi:predicted GIY-YIG superfamily endonuclease